MKFKTLLFLMTLVLWKSVAQCKEAPPFGQFPCAQSVYNTLEKWDTPTAWVQDYDQNYDTKTFRTATDKKSHFISFSTKGTFSQISQTTSETTIVFSFDESKQCEPAMKILDNIQEQKDFKDKFTRLNLEGILNRSLENKTSGFIYVWSPNMNYSLRGISEAQKIAKELKVELILLAEPNADSKAIKKIVKDHKLPEAAAKTLEVNILFERNMLDHFPSFIVYSKGRLSTYARLGYDTPLRLKAFVEKGIQQK